MRLFQFTNLAFALNWLVMVAACGHDHSDAEPYETFQLCYDAHHDLESLPADKSIVICCADHPIAGITPVCGTSAAMCEAYVRANLDPAIPAADIAAACSDYVSQLEK